MRTESYNRMYAAAAAAAAASTPSATTVPVAAPVTVATPVPVARVISVGTPVPTAPSSAQTIAVPVPLIYSSHPAFASAGYNVYDDGMVVLRDGAYYMQ